MDIFTLYEVYKHYKKWEEGQGEFKPLKQELGNGRIISITKDDFKVQPEDVEIITSKMAEHFIFIQKPLTLDKNYKDSYIVNWFGKNAIRLGYQHTYNQACEDMYETLVHCKKLLSGAQSTKNKYLFDDATRQRHRSVYEVILQKFQSRSFWKIAFDFH